MEEGKEVNQLISIKETKLEILDRMKKEEIGLIRMKLLIQEKLGKRLHT